MRLLQEAAWPWADTRPVDRLVVPRLGVDQLVLEGTDERMLAFGHGRLESHTSAREAGTMILPGHRDTQFRSLEKLHAGEIILLQARTGRWHRFAVRDRQIVDSRTATISTQENRRQLILVTCYPFAAIVPGGPLRYMVNAEIVERMAEDKP
ncbi:MAG TPA: class D sortase [Nitrospiraceae bacterium]|nr:class D sortase [Nitrospiraceae bacterium]